MSSALCVVRRPCRKQAGEGCEDMKIFVKRNGCGNYSALRNAGMSSGMQDGTKSCISHYYTDWQARIILSSLLQAVVSISHFYTNWQALIALIQAAIALIQAVMMCLVRRGAKKCGVSTRRELNISAETWPLFFFFLSFLSPPFSEKEKCKQKGQSKVLRKKRRRDLKLVQGLNQGTGQLWTKYHTHKKHTNIQDKK